MFCPSFIILIVWRIQILEGKQCTVDPDEAVTVPSRFILFATSTLFLFDTSRVTYTVKILKIGTPEIITIIVLQLEQLDFTVHYCVQKMATE